MPARAREATERIGNNCPNCGVMVSPGFDRCPSCGADVTIKGDPFDHYEEAGDFVDDEEIEGKAPASQVQRCPRCGDVVDETMPRCRRCGLPFPTRAPAPQMPPAQPPTQRTVPDFIPPEPAPPPPPPPAPPPAAPAPVPRPAPAALSGPPPRAAPRPLPPPPAVQSKPAPVPKVPLKSLSPDQRRTVREHFMKQGLYILTGLGVADLVVWVVPLWTNLIINLSMCIANITVIGFVLVKAQSHIGASSGELSEYERKRGTRVLLGLMLIFIVPFHEVVGLYPLGYTGTWGTYGSFVGMINPVLMLAGALMVAFNSQQSRERLGYFVIWRNGAVMLVFPPMFSLIQLGLPVLIYPEWFHATLGMVGGTVMVIALIVKGQRDKQFSELENAMRWGDEYAARGQPEQAIAQYDSAINMAHTLFSHLIFNPDSPYAQVRVPPAYSEPWFRKGRLLAKMKRTKKALAIFDMIIEMDPQNQVALLNSSELLSQAGEHEGALRAVDRVLAMVPNHPDAVRLRATILEAGRSAAESREKDAEAEDAESVFGTAPRQTAVPAFAAAAPAMQTALPPSVSPAEDDFETI